MDFKCDVVVVGGGVTGVAAGISAARNGAKVILLEPRPFVGGNATTGLCLHNFVDKFGKQVVSDKIGLINIFDCHLNKLSVTETNHD
jgi:flavin-dependent dehydrogenase